MKVKMMANLIPVDYYLDLAFNVKLAEGKKKISDALYELESYVTPEMTDEEASQVEAIVQEAKTALGE